jgi:NADPH:quinone reductase-like Zn-dependent oxidoreductase
MSRTLRLKQPEHIDSLSLDDESIGSIGDNECRVRITSIGLNRADVLFCNNQYFIKPEPNSRVGFEGAGYVEHASPTRPLKNALGDTIKEGDLVATCPMRIKPLNQGCLAEHVTLTGEQLLPVPKSVSAENAGGIWMAYLNAWGGLHCAPNLKDKTVLINAASSSVGFASIEIAKYLGAHVIACTSSQDKLDALASTKADSIIVQPKDETKLAEFADVLREESNGEGLDIIFDAVAGPSSYAFIKSSAQQAHYIVHGMLDRRPMNVHAGVLMKRKLTMRGYTLDETINDTSALRTAVDILTAGFNSGEFTPTISKHFDLDNYAQAFEFLQSNTQLGKVLLHP